MKTIFWCLIVVSFLFIQSDRVSAQNINLYVHPQAVPGGDGSKNNPLRRITDAVNLARQIYQTNAGSRIEIQVEPGVYRGTYFNTDPNNEDLPIVIDIPYLKLKGSTSMQVDQNNLPTGTFEAGRESLLVADPPLTANQSLIIITSTNPVLTGQSVEVSKFIVHIGYSTRPAPPLGPNSAGIAIERAQDFAVRNNYLTGWGESGIRTWGSSGKIQANYLSQLGVGTLILAGSPASPASVIFSGNRAVNNFNGGVFLSGSAITEASFDRTFAVVDGNDLSNNTASPTPGQGFGIRCVVLRHDPPNPGTSGNVTAKISNNMIRNNNVGVSIDAGFPYRIFGGAFDPRIHNGTIDLSLENNNVVGNFRTPALISFTRNTTALTPTQLNQWKYLAHSTFNIMDQGNNLNGYWFDHPVSDPVDGRILQNTLRINGQTIPNGRFVP